MKITKLGIITAMKNIGVFLGVNYSMSSVRANPEEFVFALIIYACVSIPSDLYLLNRAHESGKTEQTTEG